MQTAIPVYRRRYSGGLFAALALFAGLSAAEPAAGADTGEASEGRVAEQRRKLEAVRGEIEQVLNELENKRDTRDRLDRQMRELELEVQKQHKALRDVRRKAADKRRELERLQSKRGGLRQELNVHRDRLSGQLRAAYFTGGQEHIKLLLNQQDPAALARSLKYYEYLNEARVTTIKRAESTLAELKRTETRIARQSAELEQLSRQQQAQYRRLETARAERSATLERLGEQIADHRRSVEQLRRDESRIRELIGRLTGLFADIPMGAGSGRAFTERQGELPWPVSGPLLNRFGEPRTGSDLVWHGVQIAAPGGKDVRAVSHGRVAFADWLPGFGLVLIVDHNEGYMSLYAHNEALYKETGDWVAPGEVIASVGSTGGRQRSALYFEIRHNGRPVDPTRWCVPAGRAAAGSGNAANG